MVLLFGLSNSMRILSNFDGRAIANGLRKLIHVGHGIVHICIHLDCKANIFIILLAHAASTVGGGSAIFSGLDENRSCQTFSALVDHLLSS